MLIMALSVLALTQAEPQQAGLADAWLVNATGGAADVWLALDGQPSALTVGRSEGVLELSLEGFACETREVLPPAGRPVSRLALNGEGESGCLIRVEGHWRDAQAFLGEGGVLVALEGVSIAGAMLQPVIGAAASEHSRAGPDAASLATNEQASREEILAPEVAASRPTALATGDGPCARSASRLEDTPWDLIAMSAHGDCLAGSGRTADAVTLYERVLAFEPGHYGAALGLARLRAAQGDMAAAAALFQTAADSARTDGEARAARSAAEELESR